MKYQDKEIIICAAVRFEKHVWRGHRHPDALGAMKNTLSFNMNRKEMNAWGVGNDQGFITSRNRYVDRKQAFEIAKASRQLKVNKNLTSTPGMLYSEDIY